MGNNPVAESETVAAGGEAVGASRTHRRRSLAARPAWQASDLVIAGSLASLLLPAWLLPEAAWPMLCRALARIPWLTDRPLFVRTAASLQAALGERDHRRAAALARNLQAAVYELRMQNLRAWRPGGWEPAIALEGEDNLVKALARGNGAVLWVAHFAFNSNITKIALHRRGYRVSHLSRPEHGFSKTRFGVAALNPVRCGSEDRYLAQRVVFDRRAPSTAMRKMVQALRGNDVVSITAGAWEGSDLAEGPLCGGRLSIAIGASRLAAHAGAALLPVFSVRDHGLGFRTVIEPPIAVEASRPEMHGAAAAEFLRRHEPWVRQFPDQWRGWKELRRT
jgi:lauroyl/myristoyl acyltransferase